MKQYLFRKYLLFDGQYLCWTCCCRRCCLSCGILSVWPISLVNVYGAKLVWMTRSGELFFRSPWQGKRERDSDSEKSESKTIKTARNSSFVVRAMNFVTQNWMEYLYKIRSAIWVRVPRTRAILMLMMATPLLFCSYYFFKQRSMTVSFPALSCLLKY